MMFVPVVFIAVFLNQTTVSQILEGNVQERHGNGFFFSLVENGGGNGFDNPVFKRLDDPYFKIVKTSVGRFKVRFVFRGVNP